MAAPTDPAGVTHEIDVGETTTTDAHGTPPIVTVAPEAKLVPVMSMDVPPAEDPEVTLTDVIVTSLTH